ncbi:MAG TPA: adenylate/guanylate cyclase domain-containing protein, partial [Leptospiraceae bacterium]|nr:adenylate/guanylate cyclase domain-containing protein [Leptospiraceae bacterium]
LRNISSNYNMYINGELVTAVGKVGKSEEDSSPYMAYKKILIPETISDSNKLEILFHVSNFHQSGSGIWHPLSIGTYENIEEIYKKKIALDLVVIGFLGMMGLYHLGLYSIRKKDRSPFFLGLFCLLIVIRVLTINERLIFELFPSLSFLFVRKIEYLTFYFGSYLFFQFVYSLYSEGFIKSIFYIVNEIFLLATLTVLFFPMKIFMFLLPILQIIVLIAIIQVLHATIVAIRLKKMGAIISLLGFILFAVAIINDMLKGQGIISTPSTVSYGLLVFTFFQAIVLSRRFADGMEKSEKYSEELQKKTDRLEETTVELKQLSDNLETKVAERTDALEKTNKEIEKLNRITKKVNSVSDLTDILTVILFYLEKEYKFNEFWMLLKEEEENKLSTFAYVSSIASSDTITKMKNFQINLSESSLVIEAYNLKKVEKFLIQEKNLSTLDKTWIEINAFTYFLSLPFVVFEEVVGILLVHHPSIKEINIEQIPKLQSFTDQIAGAISNSRLFKKAQLAKEQAEQEKGIALIAQLETEKQKKEMAELSELIKSLNEELDIQKIMNKVYEFLQRNFGIQYYALYTVNPEQTYMLPFNIKFPEFVTEEEQNKILSMVIPINQDLGSHAFALRFKKPFYIKSDQVIKRFDKNVLEEQEIIRITQINSMLIIPLILDNKAVGFLDLSNSKNPLNLSKEDITRLSILGEQLAGIVHGSNLFKQVQEEKEKAIVAQRELVLVNKEIEKLNKIMKKINSVSDLTDILTFILFHLEKDFKFNEFWMLLKQEEKEELYTFSFVSPFATPEKILSLENIKIPMNAPSLVWDAYQSKKINQVFLEEKNLSELDRKLKDIHNFSYYLSLPMVVYDEVTAILMVHNQSISSFTNTQIEKLQNFTNQVAGAISNSKLFKQAQIAKEQAEQARGEIEKLNEFTKKINENFNLDEILDLVGKYILENFNIGHYLLWKMDANQSELFPYKGTFHESIQKETINQFMKLKIPMNENSGVHGAACRNKRYFFVRGMGRKKSESEAENKIQELLQFKSLLIVPLLIQNEVIGTMDFSHYSSEMNLSKEEISKICVFCEQIAGVLHGASILNQIEAERQKSEKLLLNILPKDVAKELKEKGYAEPILFENVSVMFTDFKGFTQIAEKLSPQELVKDLDACFVQFDKISERFNLEKLKTIGDSYMCAGGIPRRNTTHAIDCVLAALEIQSFMNMMKELKAAQGFPYWELRLGIHSGPLIAGVIGEKKFAYDVWGDTVNSASRMESSGTPGKINISGTTYEIVKEFFDCEYRGEVAAKNKGVVQMYYVNGLKRQYSKDEEGKIPNGKFWELYSGGL